MPRTGCIHADKRFQHLGVTFVLFCLLLVSQPPHAEEAQLSAEEVRALVAGNTLAFRHPSIAGELRYFAEDGSAIHDPERGFVTHGHWTVRDRDAKLCIHDVKDKTPYCGRVARSNDKYSIDWGIDRVPAYSVSVEFGDSTNSLDNPGEKFGPLERLSLPSNINVSAPAANVSAQVAALSGGWYGMWHVFREFALIIERIDGSGADIVYSWGRNLFYESEPGWIRIRGNITEGRLKFSIAQYEMSAHVGENGLLEIEVQDAAFSFVQKAVAWEVPSVPNSASTVPADVTAPTGGRTALRIQDMLSGSDIGDAPIHNGHFMPMSEHIPVKHRFEGRLTVVSSRTKRRRVGDLDIDTSTRFPTFSVEFVTIGKHLVPSERGIIRSQRGTSAWNIILSPGEIWSEPGDGDWSRAVFPFTLTRMFGGSSYNGIATFAFNASQVTQLRFQVVQEALPSFQFDLWGAAEAAYEPGASEHHDTIAENYSKELHDRLTFHPWSELVERHGAELMDTFDGTEVRPNVSLRSFHNLSESNLDSQIS